MYKERRERLRQQMPEYSITVMFSGRPVHGDGDEFYPFKVNRTFYYFTGIDRDNMTLVMFKRPDQVQEILFIEPFDPVMAKWVGAKMLPEEATEISGVADVRFVDELENTLNSFISNYGKFETITLCGELSKMELHQKLWVSELFNTIKQAYPDVVVKNIAANTARLRMVKDEEEIKLMKKAIAVTNNGIKAMMKGARESISENELEAYFDFILKCHNCEHAFGTICASGKNATVLHYGENNMVSQPGDMVLIDLGAAYKLYNADISRTFPLNGKFSDRQKEVYQTVLRANKMVQEVVRPGMTLRELNNKVIEFYQQELPKIGLLQDGDTVRDYYWHSVSHHLGLETHDVSLLDEPLKVGNVITDEPGLYLEDEGIGVRIEDDIMITEDGCINLSSEIMKEVEDIEAFMARK